MSRDVSLITTSVPLGIERYIIRAQKKLWHKKFWRIPFEEFSTGIKSTVFNVHVRNFYCVIEVIESFYFESSEITYSSIIN